MKMTALYRIESLKNQAVIADKCKVARSFFDRLIGLMGRRNFNGGEGLLFPRCNDVHMWFMRIPIDVVFLRNKDERKIVTSVREELRPWRPLPVHDFQAEEALELPAGTVRRCGIAKGDELRCSIT